MEHEDVGSQVLNQPTIMTMIESLNSNEESPELTLVQTNDSKILVDSSIDVLETGQNVESSVNSNIMSTTTERSDIFKEQNQNCEAQMEDVPTDGIIDNRNGRDQHQDGMLGNSATYTDLQHPSASSGCPQNHGESDRRTDEQNDASEAQQDFPVTEQSGSCQELNNDIEMESNRNILVLNDSMNDKPSALKNVQLNEESLSETRSCVQQIEDAEVESSSNEEAESGNKDMTSDVSKAGRSLQQVADSTDTGDGSGISNIDQRHNLANKEIDIHSASTPGINEDEVSLAKNNEQISDETVSSSNNQLGEQVMSHNTKQNENIWEKISGQLENKECTVKNNEIPGATFSSQSDRTYLENNILESDKKTCDDIVNFSVEIREHSEDENSDKIENIEADGIQEKYSVNEDGEVDKNDHIEINDDSSNSIPEPTSSGYIQKISSVIRAIDSSKCSTATKKDRDNIFSVLRAEISTKEVTTTGTSNAETNAIVILDNESQTKLTEPGYNIDSNMSTDENNQSDINLSETNLAVSRNSSDVIVSKARQINETVVTDTNDVNKNTSIQEKSDVHLTKTMEHDKHFAKGGTSQYKDNSRLRNDFCSSESNLHSQGEALHSCSMGQIREPVIISPPLRIESERSFMQALMPPIQSQKESVVNTDMSNIRIKEEINNVEESGDILDILKSGNSHSTETVPQTSEILHRSESTGSSLQSGTVVTVAETFHPLRIKEEPMDDYSTPPRVSSFNTKNQNLSTSNSLEHLSRQVDNLVAPRPGNIAKKSTTKQVLGKRVKTTPNVEMSCSVQPYNGARLSQLQIPPNMISKISNVVTTRATQQQPPNMVSKMSDVVNTQTRVIQQPPSQVSPALVVPSYPVSFSQPTSSTYVVASIPATTVVMSNSNQNFKSLPEQAKPMTGPPSGVFTVTKIGPGTGLQKTFKEPTPLSKSTINIDTVGLNAITELIARKNPIPNYKPPPIPDHLKSIIAEEKCRHICYECGDTFLFESSLKVHRSRTSMSLSYRCEECKTTKVFFNKCQFLGHLRCHLNIDKTQAVPIHIKSDSISITTLDHSSQMNYLFKWLDDIDTKPESLPTRPKKEEICNNQKVESGDKVNDNKEQATNEMPVNKGDGLHRCHECGGIFGCVKTHFGYNNNDLSQFLCSACKKMLSTMCSARAHKRIHEEKPPYVCPECGKSFSSLYIDNKMSSPKESFAYHVYYECFHTCHMTKVTCAKCDDLKCTSFPDYQWHLLQKLEQYYKCQVCPMAFRLPQSFQKHFETHENIGQVTRCFKVIFRCHLCDSVMDDKGVLDMHILKHVSDARKAFRAEFRCRFCKEWFKTREEIQRHVADLHSKEIENPKDANGRMLQCYVCFKHFGTLLDVLKHELLFHASSTSSTFQTGKNSNFNKCRKCGIIVFNNENNHYCIDPNPGKSAVTVIERKILPKPVKVIVNPATVPKLEKDIKPITGLSELECSLCYRVETSSRSLQGHLLYHQTKGDLVCYICQCQDFSTLEEVHKHQRICRSKANIPVETKKGIAAGKKKKKMAATSFPSIEYPCDVCGFVCYSKTDLAIHHKENHSETGIHPCHLCSLTYESQEMLRKHIMVTHEGRRLLLKCQICQKRGIKKTFSSKERLDKHLMSRHRISKNKTDEFNAGNDSEVLVADVEMDSSKETLKRKISESDESVPMKRLREDGEAQFTCAKCLYSSKERSSFVNHLAEHKIENCVQCLECGLSFAVMPTLRKHLFMVHKIKDFDNYCKENDLSELPEAKMDDSEIRKGLQIENENEQQEHDNESSSPSNPLECRVCYKTFENEAAVRAHLRVHGMAFIKNRRSKAPSQGRESVNGEETSDGSSKSK